MRTTDDLAEAKRLLPLPALMALLGHGDRAKKSARCPFHEDSSASFSIFAGTEGEPRWKCFAGCGQGDAIDYLALARNLSNADACREFKRLAGIESPPVRLATTHPKSMPSFDWPELVTAFTHDHAQKLAEWRGYSAQFVTWLHERQLVGVFDGERIAFPVHDEHGAVVGCHYRRKEDGSWRYHPTGTRTRCLTIGSPQTTRFVWAFESQWDALAVMDRLGWHIDNALPDTAVVITRGSENGKSIAGLCSPDAVVHAFAQNDPPRGNGKPTPAEKWTAEIAAHCGCNCIHVVTPPPHKDTNDWTRSGATRAEIETAIAAAQPVTLSDKPDPHAALPKTFSELAITLPEDEGDVGSRLEPFPIECLPPNIALMVRAVGESLRVPDSLPGLMALALVAASIGKGLVLDWRHGKAPTPANLFIIPSAESGSGKSECYKLLAGVFLAFERAMQEQWRKEVLPDLQEKLRYAEGQVKKLDRKLAKDSTTQDEAERLRGEMKYHLARVDELKGMLHEPQLSIQDATVEKAATVMGWSDETIFSTSADARKLCDNLLGRYSANKKLADDGIYLSAYSGDDVKVDRQGREGVRLANPCMTLLWSLQPDALEMLLDEDSLQQGGFLARCLLAHTHAEPQHIGGDLRPIADDSRDRWETLIRSLLMTYRQPPALPVTETIDEPL